MFEYSEIAQKNVVCKYTDLAVDYIETYLTDYE